MIYLVKPSRGHITQWYGARQIDGNPHAGQDYAYRNNATGEIFPEVYAAADGVVLFAGDARGLSWPNIMYLNPDFNRSDNVDSSAGNYTIIAHNDAAGNRVALTGYGHQEEIWVSAGQTVRKGQRIGTVGETGFSAGKHLHFDLVLYPFDVDDAPYYGRVDPNPYIIGEWNYAGDINQQGTTTQEDELSKAAEEDIARIREILEAGEAENTRARITSIDQRTALLVSEIAYVKSDDEPTLYERLEGNVLRPIGLTEWQATGKPYVTYPRAKFNEIFKA